MTTSYVSRKAKIAAAKAFRDSFKESIPKRIGYIFLSKSLPYADEEVVPSLLIDSVNQEKEIWDNMILGKRGISKDIELVIPNYLQPNAQEFLTVDKRIPGMWLGTHRDIPTGTYAGHFGLENGMTAITMSCVFYWNDDFEGGEFAFFDREIKYKLDKGDAIMFASNFMYPHEIMPVTKGTRYSIITWFI